MNTYVTKLKKYLKERGTSMDFHSGEEFGLLWLEGDSLYLSLEERYSMKVKDIVPNKEYCYYDVIGFNSVLSRVSFKISDMRPIENWEGLPILISGLRNSRIIIDGNDVYSYMITKLFGETLTSKELYCKKHELIQDKSCYNYIQIEGKPEGTSFQDIYLYLGWGEE